MRIRSTERLMALVGWYTDRRARRQWRALAVLSHHFLDVVAGLDTLVAFGRARPQAGRLRVLAEQYRAATMRTLRIVSSKTVAKSAIRSCERCVVPRNRRPK